jgi:uncharacterized protein with HEPN domain
MERSTSALLHHILDAGASIQSHLDGVSLRVYESNRLLQRAMEREVEIVEEACRRIALNNPAIAARITGLPQVIGFRNVIAHGYDTLSNERVLHVAATSLPMLLSDVRTILSEAG